MIIVKDIIDQATQLDDVFLDKHRNMLPAVYDIPTIAWVEPHEVAFYNYVIGSHCRRWVSTRARFGSPLMFKDAVRRAYRGQLAKINCTRENLNSKELWVVKRRKKLAIVDPRNRNGATATLKELREPEQIRKWFQDRGFEQEYKSNVWHRRHCRSAGYPPHVGVLLVKKISDEITRCFVPSAGPI